MTASATPLYSSIYHSILERIRLGVNGFVHKLPSERDLMEDFETTRVTLRIALAQLEREGTIYRSNRRGWFVTPPKLTFDPTLRSNFSVLAMQQGRRPATELLQAKTVTCKSAAEGECLGLKRGEQLYQIKRRRSIDERFVLLENIAMNTAVLPDLMGHDLSGSLTSIFRDYYNIEVAREEVVINATALSRDDAELLAVADGSFCVSIERTRYDQRGLAIEYDQEYWLHNAIEIRVASDVQSG